MITPEYLNEIMFYVEDKLIDVDNYILRKVVERIIKTFETGEKTNLLIPSTKADIRRLMASGVLYEDILKEVQKQLPHISGAIKEAFYRSAWEINKQNVDISRQIVELENLDINIPAMEFVEYPKSASDLHMTKAEIRLLESAYRRTNREMVNMVNTMPQKAYESYIQACDNAFMRINAGVSYQTAVLDAIKEVSDKGTQIEFRGRTDNIEVAVARAVRTGINQANGDITILGCAEKGISCVKTSSHIGARVTDYDDYTNHSLWQGRVFLLDLDNSDLAEYKDLIADNEQGFEWMAQMRQKLSELQKQYDYPDFMESCGYGKIQGICGINCRHSFYQFYPGIQLDDDSRPDLSENEDVYKNTQKQRKMEVAIRKTKRELEGLKASGMYTEELKAEKRRLRQKLSAQTEKYMSFCQENNLKPRNMALKV